MACVIELKDGSLHNIIDDEDMLDLVEEKMGHEARAGVEELLSAHDLDGEYIEDLEKENAELRAQHVETMEYLNEQSGILAALIREKEIDREMLSTIAGRIGTITWRELNVW